jgi:arginine/lysine/ornithine decarboxylase
MRLYEKLLEIKKEDLTSFHVPGHKGTKLYGKYFSKINSILDLDLTEIPGTDDLHSPEACILESQQNASRLYKSKQSFFLINGTTCGIYAMVMSVTSPGDKIIVSRDCHRAVFDALQLGDLEAAYVYPEIDLETNIVLGVTKDSLKQCIKENPNSKAVVLTYPNYNGVCCNIKEIIKLAHDNNMLVLVDEAHGAHLMLNDDLPISSIDAGADIVVHSSHKSLPVFTQASMLHLNSDRVSLKKLKYMLKLYQTSSPSYILMSSLDIGMTILEEEGFERMENLICLIEKLKVLSSNIGYKFLDRDYVKKKGFDLDITKLTLLGKKSNIDSKDFEVILRENGIQLEFSDQNNALFVTSICNEKADFVKLFKTMEKANYKCYSSMETIVTTYNLQSVLTIKNAFYTDNEVILLKDAIGRVSTDYIIPYPPGIPLVIPGERISNEILKLIEILLRSNQKIIGDIILDKAFANIKISVAKA